MAGPGEIKICKLAGMLIIVIAVTLITGCTACKSDADITGISAAPVQLPTKEHLMINYSEIFVPQSAEELLITNGSYVAEVALNEKKAGQLIKAGGKIRSVDFIFTPCPKYPAFCLSSYPRLLIDYSGLTYFVSVNESSGKVTGDGIIMPQDEDGYSKATFGNETYFFNGTKIIMALNETDFIFPDTGKGDILSPELSGQFNNITEADFRVKGNITSDITAVIATAINSSRFKTLLNAGFKPESAVETEDEAYKKRILVVLTLEYRDLSFAFAASDREDFVRYEYPENVSYSYSDQNHRYTANHDDRMENWWLFDKENNEVVMIFNRTEVRYLNTAGI
ncbi:hypothetical protein [Methanoplanus endosymbiosus]|uniref:Uncharacterized protein n=1 Tax=Methanoplanus endosymbiosus TaxID=33865 RepID=A0A9E7PKS4_9EURY|nr:hypothetical protein [Methanoplanus endosymbiosus]UUX91970.1 hypothetical protein L6E24_11470 [Methanoplanus endosymbiosus]